MTIRTHHSLPLAVGARRPYRAARGWRRACAGILVLLAALPFTPPFSTIDLGMLLGTDRSALIVVSPQPAAHSPEIGAGRGAASGVLLDEETFKDVTVTPTMSVERVAPAAMTVTAAAAVTSVVRTPIVALRL